MTQDRTQLPELMLIVLGTWFFAWLAMDIVAVGAWALAKVLGL